MHQAASCLAMNSLIAKANWPANFIFSTHLAEMHQEMYVKPLPAVSHQPKPQFHLMNPWQ
jgi:hypothetical protein